MKHKKELFGSISGHILEYYDVTLYGYFAAYLAPKFFPTENETLSYFMVLASFALTYLMKPFGGLIFGYFGDRYGRKLALSWSILLVTVPTFIIGVLPEYGTIGIAAPLILLICRMLQGICSGGEHPGAAIFINEHAQKGREGLASGWLAAAGFAGAVLGTGVGSVCTREFMPEWGWRIPFLLGTCFGFIGYYIRVSLSETDAFKKIVKDGKISSFPIRDAAMARPLNMLLIVGIGAACSAPYYASSIYMGGIFKNVLHLDLHQTLFINMSIMVLWCLLLPIFGALSDRFDKKKMMMVGAALTAITTYPAFYMLEHEVTLERVILLQVILTIPGTIFYAPLNAMLPTLFPTQGRYSGFGFSFPLGVALFGSMTPIFSELLKVKLDSQAAPGLYLVGVAILGIACLLLTKPVTQKAA